MKKKKGMGLVAKKGLSGYLFILPFLIGVAFIFLPAVVQSFIYSLNTVTIELDGIKTEYVGFKNYYDAFMTDTQFRVILMTATKGILVDTAIIILFSFFIANVLNQKFIGRGVTRMIFFLPVILSVGIVANMEEANAAYNAMGIVGEETAGGFDQLGMGAMFSTAMVLSNLGLPTSISSFIMTTINNTYNIVNSSGVQILLFLSALQGISPSLFEAAKVEGATKWEEFWKITFPMLTPMLLVNVVYTIIDTFINPNYGVMSYVQGKMYSTGSAAGMGFAAAVSWIYFAIILVVLGVVTAIISKRVSYLE